MEFGRCVFPTKLRSFCGGLLRDACPRDVICSFAVFLVQVHMQNSDSFTDMIFRLVQSLPKDVLNKIAMLLWAIWWTINFEGILHCVGLDMTINFEVILQPVEADAMALCKAMSWVHDRLFFNPIVKLSLMVIILIVQHNQNQK
ncbi:hypothetical protein GmHk_13G038432 [Glycine max]|nr:hypothetical protein GmHk_13G038432 [Glycine max]